MRPALAVLRPNVISGSGGRFCKLLE